MTRPGTSVWLVAASLAWGAPAWAGGFDGLGRYQADPAAVATIDFGPGFDAGGWYVPTDAPEPCQEPTFEQVEADDALDGGHYLRVNSDVLAGCVDRFLLQLPAVQGSYQARMWTRHGSIDALLTVTYTESSGLGQLTAALAPTGRVTSDGWVELQSNELPVDGAEVERVHLRVYDFDSLGADIDAVEVVPAGDFEAPIDCGGVHDPVCGSEAVCIHQRCRPGRLYVPPLPADGLRDGVVDVLRSQLEVFFGGQKTRLENLPAALAEIDKMRFAASAWQFWNGYGTAVRLLQDWHTSLHGPIVQQDRSRRLNLCFIEGDGDTSATIWPKHPKYKDLLVSHTGADGTMGMQQGDRLVAVDGQHPIAWALGLRDVDWSWHQANDDDTYAELAERMRGLVTAYAKTFTYISCDKQAKSCDPVPKKVNVADMPIDDGGRVACDNRPFYHLGDKSPPANHQVGWQFYLGRVDGTDPAEEIHALLWDTLYGGGDPDGYVNKNLKDAFALFKAKARGVILDHRAGNGGTLDGAATATFLVRPPEPLMVFLSPIETAGFAGPANAAEGLLLFNKHKGDSGVVAGSADYDPDLPVALLIHRDGSASDLFPYAFKGAPKGRIFGHAPTAGAFSTFYNLDPWGPLSLQFASGDTIGADGQALIGHGATPDVVVLQKQSDLLAGKDSVHEAGLAWVRQELKP